MTKYNHAVYCQKCGHAILFCDDMRQHHVIRGSARCNSELIETADPAKIKELQSVNKRPGIDDVQD